jgi:hypothetical protein
VGVRVGRGVGVVGSAGGGFGRVDGAVTRREFPARLGVEVSLSGRLARRVGVVALVERAAAQRSATDVVAGASAALVGSAPLGHRTALLVGVGADGFATAIDYRVAGAHVVVTDRFGWWAGLAVTFEGRR